MPRVTYVLHQTECGGIAKTVETACVLWDDAALFEAQHCIDWALDDMCRGTFLVSESSQRILAVARSHNAAEGPFAGPLFLG
jgi:hypothetical protein